MEKFLLGFDPLYFAQGLEKSIYWNPDSACHMLIVGASGSGKTYCSKQILGNIVYFSRKVKLYVANYKGDTDFSFLDGCHDYYSFSDCCKAVNTVYERLLNRQSHEDPTRNLIILYFDEYTSFLNNLEKKEAEKYKTKIATLLMLGRSFRIHILISIQRADASQFCNGARDNFGVVIGLGNLSQEAKQMLFSEYKEQMKNHHGRGCGYMTTNGTDFCEILVPPIKDWDKLHDYVRQGVENT